MDYSAYSTTSYGAQGGAGGGGFMPAGSQGESPSTGKRSYGKDTLRPVTIKQLNDAYHPHPDADHFIIDDQEATQVTIVGQVRNVSLQTTNITYRLDDGTGTMEVKVWIDAEAFNDPNDPSNQKPKPVEHGYARAWGRLKAFNNKRHIACNIIRPVVDYNEVQYHLLEATAVHLHFTRGPPEALQQQTAKSGAVGLNGAASGLEAGYSAGGATGYPASLERASKFAKIVYNTIRETPQTQEGLNVSQIGVASGLPIETVMKAAEELSVLGLTYTTVDDETWAILDV